MPRRPPVYEWTDQVVENFPALSWPRGPPARAGMMLSGLPTCGGGLGQGLWSPELWPALAPDRSACVTPEPIPRSLPL